MERDAEEFGKIIEETIIRRSSGQHDWSIFALSCNTFIRITTSTRSDARTRVKDVILLVTTTAFRHDYKSDIEMKVPQLNR